MSADKKRGGAVLLRVEKGRLVPADPVSAAKINAKGIRVGDYLTADLRKARNPGFWRLAHVFGRMVSENVESFTGLPAHTVLKRIQLEAGIECDLMNICMPNIGRVTVQVPRSLSFADMDEAGFNAVFRSMATHIAERYWPDLSPEQIERMAMTMPEAA